MTAGTVAGAARRRRGGDRAGRQARPLGKNGINSSGPGTRPEERANRLNLRWRAKRVLWEVSTLDAVRKCQRVSRRKGSGPALRISGAEGERIAGLSGLVTCGSAWCCPSCACRIGPKRAEDIRQVIAAIESSGGCAFLLTLTLRHNRSHKLRDTWRALRTGWGRVVSGRRWVAEQEQFGIIGWTAAVEVTHGAAGFHPHLHSLIFLDGPTSREMMAELGGSMFARFERGLAKKGFTAIADKGGLDVRPVATTGPHGVVLAEYLTKVAREITGGRNKEGREGNRSMFQVLADFCETGNADDFDIWAEYEQASHGMKQLTWSKGLRAWARLSEKEQTDEEIAEEDHGSEDLLALPSETWHAIRARAEAFLIAAEAGGLEGAERWLQERGLQYARVAAPGLPPPGDPWTPDTGEPPF